MNKHYKCSLQHTFYNSYCKMEKGVGLALFLVTSALVVSMTESVKELPLLSTSTKISHQL